MAVDDARSVIGDELERARAAVDAAVARFDRVAELVDVAGLLPPTLTPLPEVERKLPDEVARARWRNACQALSGLPPTDEEKNHARDVQP
jgi:hypothetical protein